MAERGAENLSWEKSGLSKDNGYFLLAASFGGSFSPDPDPFFGRSVCFAPGSDS